MARKPFPCAICGEPFHPGSKSLPPGEATHNRCRSTIHGTESRYRQGCRCDECRTAHASKMASWADGYKDAHGVAYATLWRRQVHSTTGVWPGSPRGSEWISAAERLTIYRRDDWTCQLCGNPVDPNAELFKDRASLDHIVPRSLQDVQDDSPSNLRLAHVGCNARRGNRAPELELAN